MKKSFICSSLFLYYYIKQIDSMLPCVCSVIDHRRRQNVVRTLVTYSAIASCATFLFLPHFDVICDLLPNRRTATWNLFVKYISLGSPPYSWLDGDSQCHLPSKYNLIDFNCIYLTDNTVSRHLTGNSPLKKRERTSFLY